MADRLGEDRAKARARAFRRQALRRLGLRASQLDGIAAGYLQAWAQGRARLSLVESGEVDDDFVRTFNSALRAWRHFEVRLRELGLLDVPKSQPGAKLVEYLAGKNGGDA